MVETPLHPSVRMAQLKALTATYGQGSYGGPNLFPSTILCLSPPVTFANLSGIS